jgi:amino acid transporter
MKLHRKYITPFISLLFAVLAITGIFMLFHFCDGYTEVAHELIGVGFVVAAILHSILNWNGLKIHFIKQVFMPAAIAVAVLTLFFIYLERKQLPLDSVIVEKTFKAPLKESCKILNIDYSIAIQKLEKKGYKISDIRTLEDIWKKNDTDPQEVIELLME